MQVIEYNMLSYYKIQLKGENRRGGEPASPRDLLGPSQKMREIRWVRAWHIFHLRNYAWIDFSVVTA